MVCWERDLGSRQGSRRRWRDVWFLLRGHLNGLFVSSLELHKVEHKPNNTSDCCPCLIMDRAKLSALSLSVWFLWESLSHCLIELVLLVLVWKKIESYGWCGLMTKCYIYRNNRTGENKGECIILGIGLKMTKVSWNWSNFQIGLNCFHELINLSRLPKQWMANDYLHLPFGKCLSHGLFFLWC